jgi:hypothetical protein
MASNLLHLRVLMRTPSGRKRLSGQIRLYHHPLAIADHWYFRAKPRDAEQPRLGSQKGQQVFVESLLVRTGEAVGCSWIDF